MSQTISELKQRIAELEEEKQSLEQIIAVMPGHIYWKDREGKLLGCNDQQALDAGLKSRYDIVGLKPIDLINKNQSKAAREEQAKKIERADYEVMDSGLPINLEETAILEDGTLGYFISDKRPLFDQEGRVKGIIGVTLDITKQKQLEQELRESQAREAAAAASITAAQATAASIAHDMRTPLAGIGSAARGVKKFLPRLVDAYRKAVDADLDVEHIRKEHLAILEKTMNHVERDAAFALSLITSTLQSASPAGIDTKNFENLTMVDCINTALDMYSYKLPDDKNKVHFNAENDFTFWGGKTEMLNIVFNLMKNSFHFLTKAGYGDITIWLENKDDCNELHIKDTGPGIPEEIIPTLFQPFVTHREGGTGLGLNFCKKAMTAFKGSITCQSEEGEYTKFVMVFPRI